MAYDNFKDYMYYLLTSPFKRVKKSINNWYILCEVLGSWFDECMNDIYRAREESMVATCDDIMIPVHAADRRMSRNPGESNASYRKRIAWYIEIKRLGGTNIGVERAIKALGYANPLLVRAVDLLGDENRWAEFYVLLENDIDFIEPVAFEVLRNTVRQIKYSGAKDNYLFRYYITINELTEQLFARYHTVLVIVNYNYLMLDGSWNLDGAQILSGVIRNFKVSVESNIPMLGVDEKLTNLKHIVEHNYWTLNGQVLLDGNRNLDAYRYEEEIL